LPKGAHDMAREHRVLHALAPVLPLAPRSLHFCGDAEIAGAPFQILEYRAGRAVRGSSLDPLPDTPETGTALSVLMTDTLARIHAVDPAASGLGDLGRPEGFLTRTAKGWIARAEAICGEALSTAGREVAAWLEAQTPREAQPVLLHNDIKLDNMLLHPDRIEVAAVLDWDMATRGDPFFDLATLLSYWTEAGDPPCMTALDQLPTARAGFMTREQAAQDYAARTGRSLAGFEFSRVLAVYKTAVVFHQLRVIQAGNAAFAARYAALDPDDLFVFALDIARGKVF
jgi:aminoglycoside phosphotransferase (APT) family kinase protein